MVIDKVRDRNIAYYKKYPKDIARVQEIADYLTRNTVALPSGGVLTLDRFRGLGIAFGVHGGIDSIHSTSYYLLTFCGLGDLSS